jgi:hypothetical protein
VGQLPLAVAQGAVALQLGGQLPGNLQRLLIVGYPCDAVEGVGQ